MTQKSDKKVGLALGGGYARGLAHIGVLEVFEREGIPVDIIAGTSAGALVGALYAREKDASLLRKQAAQLDWVGLTSLIDISIHKSGLLGGKKVTNFLKRIMGDVQFKDLGIPLACVATDIINGDEVILDEGSVLDAVRASISIPVIFTAMKKQGRFLVDGGLVNQVPVSVARKMGADFVIAVDVTPRKADRAAYLAKNEKVQEPSIFQIMVQSIYISTYLAAQKDLEGADLVIRPNLTHIAPADFHRAQECILEGEMTAVDSIAILKRRLAGAGIACNS